MASFLRFTRNYRSIINEEKVVIVNRDTGMWMRISKECFDILEEAILKKCQKCELLEAFQDIEDKVYFGQLLDNAEKIGVISDKEEAPKRIETVYLILTNRCNLKYKHCCVSAESINDEICNNEMGTDAIKRAIDKVVECKPDIGDVFSGLNAQKVKDFCGINELPIKECEGCSHEHACISTRCKILNKILVGDFYQPTPVICNVENLKYSLLK